MGPRDDAERVFCQGLDGHEEERIDVSGALGADAAAIRQDLVGRLTEFSTPFGSTPLVYADWTASGRALNSIEGYVASEVLPLLGNTHTSTSITGKQSTCFHHEV